MDGVKGVRNSWLWGVSLVLLGLGWEACALDQMATVGSETARKRLYPGGADEEDLQVQERLPEFTQKVDKKRIQSEVYKSLSLQEPTDFTEE